MLVVRLGYTLVLACSLVACTTSSEVGQFEGEGGDGGAAGGGGQGGQLALEPAHARLALGAANSCAMDSSGAVLCWGDNLEGQLGSGVESLEGSLTPVHVVGLDAGVEAVFGGAVASCTVMKDGHVLCWGDSVFGQFENMPGIHAISFAPMDAPGLSSIVRMGVGSYFHCALNVEGRVKCYGLNGGGQLGSGSLDDSYVPIDVLGLDARCTFLTASQSGFFACAVTTAGAAKCWGVNESGQLGDGSKQDASKAVQVDGLESGVTSMAAGREHACALVGQGVKCWGSNVYGQLGDGTHDDHPSPKDVSGLPPIVSIAAGATHTCAQSDAGAVYCWGSYDEESLSNVPALAIDSGVVELAAGGGHACALLSGEVLRCWGLANLGQLGPFAGNGAPL